MRKQLAVLLAIYITACEPLLGLLGGARNPLAGATARAQEYDSSSELFSPEQLDNLLAPIALYPDPLLAQVLPAATFVDQVDEAARWMRAYNAPQGIDDQPWDVSVKAVAHYPSVLYMMSDRIDWTTSLGQAYVNQSTDVMTSIQRLRAMAYSAGNLVTNEQQQVIVEGTYIRIDPFQPRYIYVPTYDPNIIYLRRSSYSGDVYLASIISFGSGFAIGAWLNSDWDWAGHRVYYHGWQGDRGWIVRSRPHVYITKVYVNNNYRNIRINRNVVRRRANYNNLNRYNSLHRDVNYNNRARGRTDRPANPNAGNKIIRRNMDVTDPEIDRYRGRRPAPAPQRRPPPIARPPAQRPPRDVQRPSSSVFGGNRGPLDPRTASRRGQASRERANRPETKGDARDPNPRESGSKRPERERRP